MIATGNRVVIMVASHLTDLSDMFGWTGRCLDDRFGMDSQ